MDSKSAEASPEEEKPWTQQEIEHAVHVLSVATIKYGMLKQDSLQVCLLFFFATVSVMHGVCVYRVQDIVFDLDEWAKNTGNTGPYLLYAYTRMKGVLRKVPAPHASNGESSTRPRFLRTSCSLITQLWLFVAPVVDWTALSLPSERVLLLLLNDFWSVLEKSVVARNNPAALCDYLFTLCRNFSSW